MNSFVSLLKLCKKHLDKDILDKTHDRFIELLWGLKPQRAQELEVQNPDLDKEIKVKAYQKFIKELGLSDKSKQFIKQYYADYGQRGKSRILEMSFLEFLEERGF